MKISSLSHLCSAILLSATWQVSAANDSGPKQDIMAEKNVAPIVEPALANRSVWVSMGRDAAIKVQQQFAPLHEARSFQFQESGHDEVMLVNLPARHLLGLSEFMHSSFHRCAGFFFHENLAEAQHYVQSTKTVSTFAYNYTIDNPEGVAALLGELEIDNLSETVETMASYHNRYYQQQSGADAAQWLRDTWQGIASSRDDFSVELYSHSWLQPSVIATIEGTDDSGEVVVIGGHLDSINMWAPRSGRAPGADDNASGIAVVTEVLRSMVATGFRPKKTIKFMGYAAEEVGLRGSNEIAQAYKAEGVKVIGVAQFDMTGFHGTSNADIVFMNDYTSSAQTQFMAQLLDTYAQEINYAFGECGYGCSDHASWHNQGYPASMPFEAQLSDSNSKIHTNNDTSFDPEHGIKFAILASAYVAELAKGAVAGPSPTVTPTPTPSPTVTVTPTPTATPTATVTPTPTPPPNNVLENNIAKTGLAAASGEELLFYFDVPEDAYNVKVNMSGGSGDADLYVKFAGEPTDSDYDCRPYQNGNNEVCELMNVGGRYAVRLKAYRTFNDVTLLASYTVDGGGNAEPIFVTYENVGVSWLQWQYFPQNLVSGYRSLTVETSGGSGDVSLYLRQGASPTVFNYECKSDTSTTDEVCVIENPQAGDWYIGVFGSRRSSGLTVTVKAQ